MIIRIANKDDLHAITDIYNQAILTGHSTADTETFSYEERMPWFMSHQNDQYPLYVIEDGNKVVGYVYISAYRPGRKAMVKTVEISYYIHQGFLRRGIGTKLLEFILNECSELGYKTVVAILLERNLASIRLLEKFDFEEWGRMMDIAEFDDGSCSHLYYGKKI